MPDTARPETEAPAPPGPAASPLAATILDGSAPRALRLAAARGAIPLGRPEVFRLLVALAGEGSDEEIAREAGRSIEAWPRDELARLGQDPATDPAVLGFLAGFSSADPGLLAAALANPSTPIAAVVEAARGYAAERIDVLLLNQTLLIRHPDLLEAVEANPQATALHRSRVEEIRRHFLGRPAAPAAAAAGPAPPPAPEAPPGPPAASGVAENVEAAPAAAGPAAPPAAVPAAGPAPPERAHPEADHVEGVLQRVMRLNVGDKIQLAYRGTREERAILIRDTNRSVQEAVLSSPKITESEVEAIARMRNVGEDVLRQIAANRDWMKSYAVTAGLATNPKTPLGVSMSLLSRLTTRDLKTLQTDKNVPEALRRQAQKAVQARAANPSGGRPGR
jgi:hypothetical protein